MTVPGTYVEPAPPGYNEWVPSVITPPTDILGGVMDWFDTPNRGPQTDEVTARYYASDNAQGTWLVKMYDRDSAGVPTIAAGNVVDGAFLEALLLGDVNHDGAVNGLDVDPFVNVVLAGGFDLAADVNKDGAVNGLDVAPFVAAVLSGGGVQQIPEPLTFELAASGLLGLLGWSWCRRTR
jgi:hypothetical protein